MDTPSSNGPSFRGFAIAGFAFLVLLVGGLGGWSVSTQISGAVIAQGSIQVEQNRQIVQHPDGGVVAQILVGEGDRVSAEDVLIQLDDSELLAELQIIESQLAEILARTSRFTAERDEAQDISFDPLLHMLNGSHVELPELIAGQERLFQARRVNLEARVNRLKERISQIHSQIDGIMAQQESIDDQLVLLQEELVNQQNLLDQGLAQAGRVLALQREEARLRGQAGALTAQRSQAAGQITELELEILNQSSARREEAITTLRDLQVRRLELIERRNILMQRLSRLELRAPVAGVVYDLAVFARKSVIRPADPLMFLVPQDQPLVITAQINTDDVDQIYLGQPVNLKFTSFNQRTTPSLFGEVSRVSADAFQDQQTGRSYFEIEARLNAGEAQRLGQDNVLVPGMPVEVFAETGSQTPMDYLIQPFTDYLGRAFREF
ncbi:HlyD family secretion protein [Epibacterium ulvae]|uniref:Membrane fusion protein (MFP) family protein n=1 Tax=Epibacterium ulvae TaxID=1156985 RepID=A0A1G5RDF6_9RHOB|nr:HlyD family type I secretion periplasmic adaptor subunit [Epibacterium ulvae]SCZ71908.1 HlyD family secretion protein [Epibacterium ulvae]